MGGLALGDPPWLALCMVRIAQFLRSVEPVGVLVSGGPPWAVLRTVRIALFRRFRPWPLADCPIGRPRAACGVVPVLSCAPPFSRASAS